ncbi:hypothetical protein MTZ49_09215 [Entomomonas sp. E2T0]|nr:hypothetical protein [Entomomonas sp. E2T0]UYZ82791.1 hypothetical protein MTZ49_09215 [Entomomonas sp. E2T0]
MSKRCDTDWFRVICDLNKFNLSLQAISNIIQVPKPTIVGWKQGAEPKHGDGEKLVKLWCSVTGGSRTDLPGISKDAWWSYHFKMG